MFDSYVMGTEWSARGFASMEVTALEADVTAVTQAHTRENTNSDSESSN